MMEEFIADFHVHSRFSIATSRDLNLESLYAGARQKGISVVGTGDFTHPGWFAEISEKLVADETGLFALREDIARKCDESIPKSCKKKEVRFVLTSEISNIYKKNGKTRKNHNLAFVPDLDCARRLNAKLETIGNIASDGRPILGLDAKHLLEILLELSERAFLIPAHIWTPWFSMLGSRSGFDSVQECFEDMASHIFALETGLSSDPPMNWRVSQLDPYTLVSNSDAHSAGKLGREANIFACPKSYEAIRSALNRTDPEGFKGTIEFFPEEGKYHFDGHRKCFTRLHPKESLAINCNCPVCGKPLTLGVLHRIEELADRKENESPGKLCPFSRLVPLTQILSEILKAGVGSNKVLRSYRSLLEDFGTELGILKTIEIEELKRSGIPLLAEAIRRVRHQRITIRPGFDGEFGSIRIFDDPERESLSQQKPIFDAPHPSRKPHEDKSETDIEIRPFNDGVIHPGKIGIREAPVSGFQPSSVQLNAHQREAVEYGDGELLIIAGPGTGKTRTLTHRIAHLIAKHKVSEKSILAVTFTKKAAEQMRHRLREMLKNQERLPEVGTFHAVCMKILRDYETRRFGIADEPERKRLALEAVSKLKSAGKSAKENPSRLLNWVVLAKQRLINSQDRSAPFVPEGSRNAFVDFFEMYQSLLENLGLFDFEDLIFRTVRLLECRPDILRKYQERFRYIFVDEYQDLNLAQYRLIRLIYADSNAVSGRGLCAIGDPNQSIYSFRGADVVYFHKFISDFPGAKVVYLTRNYRSTETILKASHQIIKNSAVPSVYSGKPGIPQLEIIETASGISEAETVARIIEKLVGGVGFFSIDSGRVDGHDSCRDLGFSDIAVLFRTHGQLTVFEDVFKKRGVPCQVVRKTAVYDKTGLRNLLSMLRLFSGAPTPGDLEKVLAHCRHDFPKKKLKHLLSIADISVTPADRMIDNLIQAADRYVSGETIIKACKSLLKVKSDFEKIETLENRLRFLADLPYFRTDFIRHREAFETMFLKSCGFKGDAADFYSDISLETDADELSKDVEKVALMTIHSAKGLEFEAVFVSGCEEGYIPFRRFGEIVENPLEERNLFYVAMTRAKETLIITWAKRRRIFGRERDRKLSPFIDDIQKSLKKPVRSINPEKKKQKQIQLELFGKLSSR